VILYTKFAYLMPGILYAKGSSWERIASYLYLDSNGMLGLPLDVAAGVVVAFIFFGQALYAVGGDKFLTDLALIATGRYRGGPARLSLVSSDLFGTSRPGTSPMSWSTAPSRSPDETAASLAWPRRSRWRRTVADQHRRLWEPPLFSWPIPYIPYSQVALAAAIPACLCYVALFT
jgi:TRAP-type uncharacterized transport system fused permease subunit